MTAGTTGQDVASDSGAVFEIERFEWSDDGRIEVTGAWSGLRGKRFVRPTLEVEGEGVRRRLLALLDHKPWAPEHVDPWIAAFRWDGDRVAIDSAQLHVAPGVVVELPPPSEPGRRARKRPATRVVATAAPMKRRPGKATPKPPQPDAGSAGEPPAASVAEAATTSVAEGATASVAEPSEAPAASAAERDPAVDVDAMPAALAAAHERLSEAERRIAALERERDDAVVKRRATAAELEALRQAHQHELSDARAQERENAASALAEGAKLRERVERERDDAVAQREIAYRERDDALAAKEQALDERRQAIAERKAALRERDKADRERDKSLREADRALADRDEALLERDRAIAERDLAVNERDALIRAHERGLPLRPPKPKYLRDDGRELTELEIWMPRAVSILVLGVFVIVVLRLFL